MSCLSAPSTAADRGLLLGPEARSAERGGRETGAQSLDHLKDGVLFNYAHFSCENR